MNHLGIFDRRQRRHGRCGGQNMRLLGEAVPFVSGIDTPQTPAKCMKERKLAVGAKKRPKELLAERGLKLISAA
ncbi:hypothetical protein [Rhizobium sp. WSM1325]|uniref:hypothetical protein n=1 Tax=Rhizobium sp. WSM1325 TaxID=3444086 RepID=UPI0032AF9F90